MSDQQNTHGTPGNSDADTASGGAPEPRTPDDEQRTDEHRADEPAHDENSPESAHPEDAGDPPTDQES